MSVCCSILELPPAEADSWLVQLVLQKLQSGASCSNSMACDIGLLTCIVQILLRESMVGSDVHTCSCCQRHTRKCTSCRDGFAWGNGILNSLQCAVCIGSVRSWSKLESPITSVCSAICSWCLQKSVHHLIEKNTLRRSV